MTFFREKYNLNVQFPIDFLGVWQELHDTSWREPTVYVFTAPWSRTLHIYLEADLTEPVSTLEMDIQLTSELLLSAELVVTHLPAYHSDWCN